MVFLMFTMRWWTEQTGICELYSICSNGIMAIHPTINNNPTKTKPDRRKRKWKFAPLFFPLAHMTVVEEIKEKGKKQILTKFSAIMLAAVVEYDVKHL